MRRASGGGINERYDAKGFFRATRMSVVMMMDDENDDAEDDGNGHDVEDDDMSS